MIDVFAVFLYNTVEVRLPERHIPGIIHRHRRERYAVEQRVAAGRAEEEHSAPVRLQFVVGFCLHIRDVGRIMAFQQICRSA